MSGLKNHVYFFIVCCWIHLLQSCSVSKQINKQAHKILLQDSVINTGHTGISIFEPATNTYWYNYNADKYFVPASNVKLFTLYAGMKYLGDSLVGLRYKEKDTSITIYASGDPTFLHPDFMQQPVSDFLIKQEKKKQILLSGIVSGLNSLGRGWAWDDYMEKFMARRSAFPIYGNVITIQQLDTFFKVKITPDYFRKHAYGQTTGSTKLAFTVSKSFDTNELGMVYGSGVDTLRQIPFNTNFRTIIELIEDTFHLAINKYLFPYPLTKDSSLLKREKKDWRYEDFNSKEIHTISSQPVDSLFTPMMHNSDNFFAEQTLLMASNEHLGYMDDQAIIIDTLLKTDLKDVPQQPRWVDGSGLSRYNLFTPQSFVYILNKMKNEFGLERLKTILPTGGEGTLKNYYNSDSSFIYAKTGSLSNQIALSGFLITKQNKLLVFSLLTNNAIGDGWKVRRAYELFLQGIRQKY